MVDAAVQSALASFQRNAGNEIVELSSDTRIFGLARPVAFAGPYEFQVLKGSVEVGGTLVAASAQAHTVVAFFPPWYCLKPVQSTSATDLSDGRCENYFVVVRVTRIDMPDLSPLVPFHSPHYNKLEEVSAAAGIILVPPSWRDAASKLDKFSRSVVLGLDSSGKSSLARYLYNEAISQNGAVYYLDLNTRKGELCPPGTLSLHKLTSLNFKASYANASFEGCIKAHSFGYISVTQTPQRFLDIARDLIETWKSIPDKHGIIVNMPGGVHGLVHELNRKVISMIDATHAFCIGEHEDFKDLVHAFHNTCVEPVENVKISSQNYVPWDKTVLQTACYFYLKTGVALTHWTPYEVPWGDLGILAVGVLDSEGVIPEDIPLCLEGTIVSICTTRATNLPIAYTKDRLPYLPNEVAMDAQRYSQCRAYAVVQTVDPQRRWIRLITPFNPDSLSNERVILLRGRLELPIWMFWQPKNGRIPWVNIRPSAGIGGSVLEPKHLQRINVGPPPSSM